MSKYNVSSGGGDFETTPAGNHIARIYSIVDIGDQSYTDPHSGKVTNNRKVVYSFELVNEKMADGRPFVVSKFYTASLHEKATLLADLNSLRGVKMTQEDKHKFADQALLAIPCMVNVVHAEKQGGGVQAKVSGLSAVPKGMQVPDQVNQLVYFDLDNQIPQMLELVPDWIKEKINWDTVQAAPAAQGQPTPNF